MSEKLDKVVEARAWYASARWYWNASEDEDAPCGTRCLIVPVPEIGDKQRRIEMAYAVLDKLGVELRRYQIAYLHCAAPAPYTPPDVELPEVEGADWRWEWAGECRPPREGEAYWGVLSKRIFVASAKHIRDYHILKQVKKES